MKDPVIRRNYFFLLWIFVTFASDDSQAFNQGSIDNVFYANFTISKFSYLNITSIGRELNTQGENVCGLACLEIPSCFSYNVAAFPDVNGKLLCELLPSDKFNNSDKFNASREFHHISIASLCDSSPCKNAGKCISLYQENGYKCICVEGFTGKNCETSIQFTSCREIYLKHKSKVINKAYFLQIGSGKIPVYCHMDNCSIGACGGGGWTMVMKIDGQKSTFHYDSKFWNNQTAFNPPGGETGFDHKETKLPTYWNLPFSQICLVMKMGQQIRSFVMKKHANSLYSLIADNHYRSTSLGRSVWKTLIGSQASLQSFCNKEGFNVVNVNLRMSKARIGIVSNNQNDCSTCDSRIGFGTGGLPDDSNSCGNEATYSPDNGDKHIKTMGYILVK